MKKVVEIILRVNTYLFFLLYIATFSIAIVESIKYRGFAYKHLSIGFGPLLAITIISGIAIFLDNSKKSKLYRNIWNYYYQGQLFISPLIFTFWAILEFLNLINYENYVFTKFHIIPENLLTAIFLSIFLIAIETIYSQRGSQGNVTEKSNRIKLILFVTFILIVLQKDIETPLLVASDLNYISQNLTAPYEKKMSKKWGEDIYTLVDLIKKSTPENSTILIPTRDYPWLIEGNDHLMRGFLYPRTIISYKQGLDLDKFDYVLISAGLWKDVRQKDEKYIFPAFDISAKKIHPFNLNRKVVEPLIEGSYIYNEKLNTYRFGLIER